jgi:dimethylsulfoniopropionate demethylase
MMKKPYWEVSQSVKAEINGNICTGNVCDLPFI